MREGLVGLLETHGAAKGEGLWKHYDRATQERDLGRVNGQGSMPAGGVFGLESYVGDDRVMQDSQIGSVGGGNHFVEIQRVAKIIDRQAAYAWGLKQDHAVVMIHTGCVSIGYGAGAFIGDVVKRVYPPTLTHPENGVFLLPDSERHQKDWRSLWTSISNAANFAFANRLFLGLMAYDALLRELGPFGFDLVYDTGHNIISREEGPGGEMFYVHRKGANPARGLDQMAGTAFEYYGEPVLIPGSMGSSSFVLAGLGNERSLRSTSHGAGRALSRGRAMRHDERRFREFLERFRIVTPIDPARADVRARPDIIKKWEEELKQEAPYAYKDIGPVIQTQVDAGMARVVAELEPILTVKG